MQKPPIPSSFAPALPGKRWSHFLQAVGIQLGLFAIALLAAPASQAQWLNGGFEDGTTIPPTGWVHKTYTRQNNLPASPPVPNMTTGITLGQLGLINEVTGNANNRSAIVSGAPVAINGTGPGNPLNVTAPRVGNNSLKLNDKGSRYASSIEQTATMTLADVDATDNKVHLRFIMAPVLVDGNHDPIQQPYFYVEVRNTTKNKVLFHTYNYSNQPGVPWQTSGDYRYTDWQLFDIAPGNGQMDVGDTIRIIVYAANCSPSAFGHEARVYMDTMGSQIPGLAVYATGPSVTTPGAQITYAYNYTNNSGALAFDSRVRLAAPFTENGLPLTFVAGSWPAGCTGPHAGAAGPPARGDYIDCPVGDLNPGATGSFNVTFTVPAGAATTQPNNVINNADYDIRAISVSATIGPMVKTTLSPASADLVDLGVTVSNGGLSSYTPGQSVTYTVTATNYGPISAAGTVTQTLTGLGNDCAALTFNPGAPDVTCTPSGSGVQVTFDTGTLNVNGTNSYTVTGSVPTSPAPAAVNTVATIAPNGGLIDNNSSNNTDGLNTPVGVQHNVTVNATGSGTGYVGGVPAGTSCGSASTSNPCTATGTTQAVVAGSSVYLNPVAHPGSQFVGWQNCVAPMGSVVGSQCVLSNINADITVTAVFTLTYVVTPHFNPSEGTVTPGTGQVVLEGGSSSFTITPATPGNFPVITTPAGKNVCPGVLTGPDGSGNYSYVVSPVLDDCDFEVTFETPDPKLTVVKTVTNAGSGLVNGVITYQIVARNAGNVPLSNVTVNDANATIGTCSPVAPATLAPAATMTCTATHTVTQADVDAGSVHNSATATGTPPNIPGNPPSTPITSDPSEVDTPTIAADPGMSVVKSVTSTGSYELGDTISYQIVAANTGNVTLTAVSISDANATIGTCSPAAPATLAPAAAMTCTATHVVTQADVNQGNVVNTAASTATPPTQDPLNPPSPLTPPSNTVTTPVVQTPAILMDKRITSSGPYVAGSSINYLFDVTNIGNVTLTNVQVDDPLLGGVVLCAVSTLDPGDSTACGPASYPVTTTDVLVDEVYNSAVAYGTPPTGAPVAAQDSVTTGLTASPSLELLKSVTSSGPYAAGDTITYSFVVTNTGNVVLTSVAVNDPMLGGAVTCAATTLAPGASTTCGPVNYTVTAGDVTAGSVANTATATGNDPDSNTVQGTDTITTPLASTPGVTLVKEVVSVAPYLAGDTITYYFTVTNTGNVVLNNVAVNDPLFGGSVSCAASTLAVGASTTCGPVNYTVTAGDAAVGEVVNTATASAEDPANPGVPVVDTDSVITPIGMTPSLSLLKSVISTGPYTMGSTISYLFTVTNTGNVVVNSVSVNDPLLGGVVTCSPTTLNPTEVAYCGPVNYTVTSANATAGQVVNTATASGRDPGNNPVTATDTETTEVVVPNLGISKTASPNPFVVGGAGSYTLTVTNTGTSATTAAATVTDVIPAGLTIGTLPAGCSASGQTVTCTVAAGLPALTGTVSFVIPVTVTAAATTANNTASVVGGGDPDCVVATDCTVSVTVPVISPDLRISKTASPSPFVVGIPASYTLTVTNTGTSATTATATVTDVIPAGLTIGTLPAGCSASGQTVTCTVAAGLPATFGTVNFVIPVTATAAAANGNNTASVVGGGDPDCVVATDCTATVNVPVISPDLVMTKAASPTPFVVGGTGTYTITVTNNGASATTAVATVTDTVPTGLTIGTLPAGCSASGQTVTCTVAAGLAASGGVVSFAIPVTVTATATTANNTASVVGGGDPDCVAATDCTATVTVPVIRPDLAITKTADPVPFVVGRTGTYTLTVTNTGTSATTATATVSDVIPAGLTIGTLPAGCSASGQTVTCTVAAGLAASGGVVSFAIPVTVTATATTANNTASVVGGGDPDCVAATDCTATVTVPVTVSNLTIVKTGPAVVQVGNQAVFTIVVQNTGTGPADGVTVADPTPAGLEFVSNTGDCVTAFPCALGTMAVGETRTITVTLLVPGNYMGDNQIINIATVSSTSTTETSSSTATVPMSRPYRMVPVNANWALLLLAFGTLFLAAGGLRRHLD